MNTLPLSLFALILAALPPVENDQGAAGEASRCHVFIDLENIWTVEMVEDAGGKIVPILNAITFTPGKWEFRPRQIQIQDATGREARVERFSVETGVPGEPYLTEYFPILGNSFIGLDLVGNFEELDGVTRVVIDLHKDRFHLQPVDCLDFERLAEKINQINVDSPDVRQDFEVLGIEPTGRMEPGGE